MIHRRPLRRTVWLAVCAILWSTLVPSFATMLGAGPGSVVFMEICSAQGTLHRVADPAGAPETDTPPVGLLAECPLCAGHAPALPGPASGLSATLPQEAGRPLGHRPSPPVATHRAWSNAHPRAPPLAA
jgi:hypothetical protein